MESTFRSSTKPQNKLSSVLLILVSVLLLSFHFFFVYFVNSTYLQTFVGEAGVSFVYAIGAILNIVLFLKAPKILRRYSLLRMTLGLTFLEIVALVVLAFPFHPLLLILAFLLHMSIAPLLIYCMDMFLVQYEPKEETGSTRGMFLTMWNLPTVITPFIAGLIITTSNLAISGSDMKALHDIGYWKIYLISAAFLIPFMIILKTNFGNKQGLGYPDMHIKDTLMHFLKHKNIYDVFVDRILLNLFFAWNAIYLPIYLHNHIGFAWEEVGILLVMTSLPFILFQRKIGQMQDKIAREKPLLIAGFLIMAIGTMMFPFMTIQNPIPWALLLFIVHTGASVVEVSSESYFFKHVSPTNSGFISLFRMTRALPYIIIPVFAASLLPILPFSYIFLILGLIMLVGMRYAFLLK